MSDRALLATMAASLYDGALAEARRLATAPAMLTRGSEEIAIERARSILAEIDKAPPQASVGEGGDEPFDDMEGRGQCGGRRCFKLKSGDWVHSSKSYTSCSVRRDKMEALVREQYTPQPAPPARVETPTVNVIETLKGCCAEIVFGGRSFRGHEWDDTPSGKRLAEKEAEIARAMLTARPAGNDGELERLRAQAKLGAEWAETLRAIEQDYGELSGVESTEGFGIVGMETESAVDWLHRWNETEEQDPPAPPPVARETTSADDLPPMRCFVCLEDVPVTHAGMHAFCHMHCEPKMRTALDAARQLSPSGEEKGVDVEKLLADYWDHPGASASDSITAALKGQGITTRAPKVDGGQA